MCCQIHAFCLYLGFFCTEGTANPYKCEPGKSQLDIGQSECLPCKKGHYCPIGADDANPIICPPFHYCPEGSYAPTRCPNGTYTLNTTEGYESVSQCMPCVPGSYCRSVYEGTYVLKIILFVKWLGVVHLFQNDSIKCKWHKFGVFIEFPFELSKQTFVAYNYKT